MQLLVTLFGSSRFRLLLFFMAALLLVSQFSMPPWLAVLPVSASVQSLLTASAIAALLTLNIVIVGRCTFRKQLLIYWSELLLLVLAFFYSFDLSLPFITERLPLLLLTGVYYTLLVSGLSIIFASMIALVGALARLSNSGLAYAVATFYVSFFRGTPLLLQVYLIYLGLPQLGIVLDAIPSGVLALSLSYGAYMTEIFRSGIQAVPASQTEAASALGLKPWMTLQKIILPQAFRIIIPPIGNNFISMLKDSSLVSAMGVMELMYLARTLGRSEFKHFEMLITAALIYWAISFVFELVQARLEERYGRHDQRS